ncbi:MAG: polysaccharide deacetylase family protein [Candidatus Nanopelagicales bacterium]
MTARELARTAYRIGTRPVGSIQRLAPTPGQFVLTYDDGPDPRYTPGILAVLDTFGATATFFVLLSKVRRDPHLLREVHAAGHEIALHGIDHQRLTTFTSQEVQRRTAAGKAELEDVLGSTVKWMRPPYGAQRFSTWRAIRSAGVEPVMWSGTFWDWKDMPHERRVQKAMSSARPGALLLAHDSFPDANDGVAAAVEPQVERAQLAHDVLAGYADLGLQARSLNDALVATNAQKWAWFSK